MFALAVVRVITVSLSMAIACTLVVLTPEAIDAFARWIEDATPWPPDSVETEAVR